MVQIDPSCWSDTFSSFPAIIFYSSCLSCFLCPPPTYWPCPRTPHLLLWTFHTQVKSQATHPRLPWRRCSPGAGIFPVFGAPLWKEGIAGFAGSFTHDFSTYTQLLADRILPVCLCSLYSPQHMHRSLPGPLILATNSEVPRAAFLASHAACQRQTGASPQTCWRRNWAPGDWCALSQGTSLSSSLSESFGGCAIFNTNYTVFYLVCVFKLFYRDFLA